MICYDPQSKQFVLSTRSTTMVIRHGAGGLYNVYWGGTIRPEDIEPEEEWFHSSFDPDLWQERLEFPIYNGRLFTQPALIAGQNGQNALMFRFESYRTQKNCLFITLACPEKRLELILEYQVYEAFDLIGRRATLKNNGAPIEARRFFSGCFTLPAGRGERLRYLTGKWSGECQIQDRALAPGNVELQSLRGIPGPHFNPSFALHDHAAEETGDVWFGLLAYSENWKICVERTAFGNTHVLAGRNDQDGAETLKTGESLTTPLFYGGFSAGGFGAMSRLLHAFQRAEIIKTPSVRPVLYNSWEATGFAVNVESQKKLAAHAAEMGVELFVVDDGWFGQRHSDAAGLGDWWVNAEKFPNGLEELICEVKRLGMGFGIWVEPEAVNPNSGLYRKHPDWIYRIPGIEPATARNQYVLDLSLPQVKAYVKGFLEELLSRYDIQYLKWDMNRSITDVGGGDPAGNGKQRRAHAQALYEIWAWLRERFPQVALESCSGGGGRVDLGILQWASTFWPSDNTDPYDRLFIQEGFTQFYAPATMTCWVTDTPDQGGRPGRCATAYKFHSAMCGPLGIGADIGKLSVETRQEYKRYIAVYKELRATVQLGELYRLASPATGLAAVQYIYGSQVVVLAFLHSQCFGDRPPRLRLRGLNENCVYSLKNGRAFMGSTLMNRGIELPLAGDFSSCLLAFNSEG